MTLGFVAVADGLAMLLPGPASSLGGAAFLALGLAWLVFGLPRLMSRAGRAYGGILVTRFGLFALPVLCLPVAGLWFITTPAALSPWFAVAWFVVWAGCVVLSASLPCPECGQTYGRRGLRLQGASSACAHCGADPSESSSA